MTVLDRTRLTGLSQYFVLTRSLSGFFFYNLLCEEDYGSKKISLCHAERSVSRSDYEVEWHPMAKRFVHGISVCCAVSLLSAIKMTCKAPYRVADRPIWPHQLDEETHPVMLNGAWVKWLRSGIASHGKTLCAWDFSLLRIHRLSSLKWHKQRFFSSLMTAKRRMRCLIACFHCSRVVSLLSMTVWGFSSIWAAIAVILLLL